MKPKPDSSLNSSLNSRTSVDLDSADVYACAAVLLTVISRQLNVQAEADKSRGVIGQERLVELQRVAAGVRGYAQELY